MIYVASDEKNAINSFSSDAVQWCTNSYKQGLNRISHHSQSKVRMEGTMSKNIET